MDMAKQRLLNLAGTGIVRGSSVRLASRPAHVRPLVALREIGVETALTPRIPIVDQMLQNLDWGPAQQAGCWNENKVGLMPLNWGSRLFGQWM